MHETVRIFAHAMLSGNFVFCLPGGALLALAVAGTNREAFVSAVRLGLVLALAGLTGGSLLPVIPEALHPLVLALTGTAGIGILYAWGELRGKWLDLPLVLIGFFPLAVFPLHVSAQTTWHLQCATALGLGLGFTGATILIGFLQEACRISESGRVFKTLPVVLFSMGVLALLLQGFVLL